MKWFKIAMLASLVALPAASVVKAADLDPPAPAGDPSMTGFYLRGDLGWSWLDWDGGDNDNAFVGGAGLGYQFTDMFRADITGNWTGKYDIGPGDISTTALMANAYLDLPNSTPFTPYVGVGAGYGWVNGSGGADDDSGVALGATVGASAALSNNLSVDVGYHFRQILIDGDDPREHQVTAGLRFSF
ncbi:MAG: porin family protein [Proteobacteria bacterium]|nr:porin family protein [Pseudomonadota bacterium]